MIELLSTAFALVFVAATAVFFVGLYRKDNSKMDIAYGLIFIFAALGLYATEPLSTIPQQLLTALVVLWGTRLSLRIYLKNRGKPEDFRYAKWREEWMEEGTLYFVLRSYAQIYLLQSAVIFVVLLPVILVHWSAAPTLPLAGVLGAFVWLFGFSIESVADIQLDRFLKREKKPGEIMESGLFRYSRRPNYFGEALQWWGIALISASVLPAPYSYIVYLSPITITYILLYVTGPMLERKMCENPNYREYAKRTNYFIPWPRKEK